MYQEIKPSHRTDYLIDSFWTFSSDHAGENFKVLPDTCADLIFDLNQNKGFLSGIMTNFQLRELANGSNLLGIRFKSEKFGLLSEIPLNETKNLRVELSEVFPRTRLDRLSQLTDLQETVDKIEFLEAFIETSFKQNSQKEDKLILSVAKHIRKQKGIVHVGDLATSYHISLRQLERRFKSYIGLSIKEFSSIVRFKNARNLIATSTKTSLLEIAFDMGFFDHAHMTYEFKRISGENPSSYR